MRKGILIYSLLCWGLTLAIQAGPISLTGAGYTQDFDTLMNTGTVGGGSVPDNSELTAVFFGSAGSGWWNGSGQSFASATTGPLANSSRMLSFGSVDGDSERSIAAGRQGTSEAFGAQFQNDTGGAISELTIQYDGEQWYCGNSGLTLSFFISTDATDLFSGTWTPETSLDFVAPDNIDIWQSGDGNLPANRATVSDTISVNIPAGATFFIRFGGDEANDAALAIDNFSIIAGAAIPGPPSFTTSPTVKPTALIDVAYSQSLSADVSEGDGDAITYTKLDGSAWLTIAPSTGDLSGTPTIADSGAISSNHVFLVELSDVDGATTGEVHIVVSTGIGTAPTFTANPTVKSAATADEAYSGSLAGDISEPDGDTVTFGKLTGDSWLTIAPTTGDLSGTPGAGDVGLKVFTIEVFDVDGASTGTVHITVAAAPPPPPPAGTANVDVNWNIEHSVGGVSDFGRERHITVHSAVTDPDWDGQEDKLDYLMSDLDAYFGRDNGSATWKFSAMQEDPARPNYADPVYMNNWLDWWDTQYDANANRLQYEAKATEMIMGHNPHPVYPTLSWYDNGFTWTGWQPTSIEASAEYVVNYLDWGFRRGAETSGEQPPKYWEIINEPDMLLMTGQFMVSSWEDIFEYHNLVATGVKERLGDDAPMIGGMTWGEHDFQIADAVSRWDGQYYYDLIIGGNPGDPATSNGAAFYRDAGTSAWEGDGTNWDQWDKIWQNFVDHCGSNMDFYSVHIYDWPGRGFGGTPRLRTGGHTEGMLDIMEWYDVHKFGEANRKPIVLSEYGSVSGMGDGFHSDWECLRPFNSMMMQFLERPDYIVKSMPFSPIKAEWGNYYDANGNLTARYAYTLMDENPDGSDNWEWSGYIKWYELWADVDGTRVETQASDPDILVDAYVNGDHAFLILNNLERESTLVNLHEFGLGAGVDSVRIKHLYAENYEDYAGTSAYPVLDDYTLETAPGSVVLDPEATMIIRYNFGGTHTPAATLVESKVYGEKLAPAGQLNPRGGELFRVQDQVFTGNINGVTLPTGPAEAVLRISGSFVESTLTSPRPGLDYIRINGHDLPYLTDWRGQEDGTAGGWGQLYTLEVPVPIAYLQANNVISGQFNNTANRYAAISLQIFDFSVQPGRYGITASVPVTGMSITETSLSMPEQRNGSVTAVITPAHATDKSISWSSSNSSVASVDPYTGQITAVSAGSATITATTDDGGFTDNVTVTVTGFVPWEVESVRVNPVNATVLIGEATTSVATVLPENAANKAVSWSSSDPSVASVNASGIISAVGAGVATITATTTDGGFTDTTVVTVPDPVAVTGVSIPATALIISGGTLQLTAAVSPANATYPSVTWASLTPAVATVNASGLVTAVGEGTAEIQVTTDEGGFTSTCMATIFVVGPDGTSFTVEAEDLDDTGGVEIAPGTGINTVEAGDWAEYNITVPENGIYKIVYQVASPEAGSTITFVLDGMTIATDDVPNTGGWEVYNPLQSGGYVALSAGSHTVRLVAGTKAWQWNLDKFVFTKVAEGGDPVPVDGVSVSPTASLIAQGATVQLTETVSPGNATDKSVTWTSLNPAVASVSANGLVSGLLQGSAEIVVTTTDGGFAATNSLTVTPGTSVDGVSVSPINSQIQIGYTVQLTETVTPPDALDKTVTWSSLNPGIATVDAGGLVSGIAEGIASIVVTTADGGYTATNETVVTAPPPVGPVMDLQIDGGNLILNVTNGTADAEFTILASSNLVEGAGWEPVSSDLTFDAMGDAFITNAMGDAEQIFFKVEDSGVIPQPTMFDWEETTGSGRSKWDDLIYTETDNGVTMTTSGRIFTADGQPYAIKYAYDAAIHDRLPGIITMEEGGAQVDFAVQSIDISQVAGTDAGSTKYVRGILDTVIQWEIIAPEDGNVETYTTPTSGDMSLPIDTIEWHAGWLDAGVAFGYESRVDNLVISVVAP